MKPMLARDWKGQDPTGWLLTEKLNGFRALWTGERLVSRSGKVFPAPAWFLKTLPADVPLDGELYAGRDGFATVQSCAQSARESGWRKLSFIPFDLPASLKTADARAAELAARFPASLPARVCLGLEDMKAELWKVFQAGGEGLVLRRPDAYYQQARHDRDYAAVMLKVRCEDFQYLLPTSFLDESEMPA